MNSQNKSTVLFVDDESFVLDALRRVFRQDEYTLLFAGNANEAMTILERTSVQVVVSDFRMPGMNGGEFLHAVAEKWPDTIRIILSGFADMTSVISSINEGQIYKFISKPWRNEELLEVVRASVEKYWQQIELRALAEAALAQNDSLLQDHLDGLRRIDERQSAMERQVDALAAYQFAFESAVTPTILFRDAEFLDANSAARSVLDLEHWNAPAASHPIIREMARRLADSVTKTPARTFAFNLAQSNGGTIPLVVTTDKGLGESGLAVAQIRANS